MPSLREIIDYCDTRLDIRAFDDYCPNGLQVEAGASVRRIVTGVTACLALIEAARDVEADLLLVHHGYFWKGEPQPLTGMKGKRVRELFAAGMSMAAYHLPLDAHPELGNNVRLGRLLGFAGAAAVTQDGLLWGAELSVTLEAEELRQRLCELTGREALLLSGGAHPVKRVAWCTGGAQSWLSKAADQGYDAFITGEASEASFHIARERNIHFYSAGHHATERHGIQALGEELSERFGVRHEYIDIPNPV
ncbi:Nif3-like dinuclear metal center hexameric protein [Thiolapillus sp.]